MVRWSKARAALLVLTVSLLVLSGCSTAGAGLDGTKWRLTEWTISSIDPAAVTITAQFAGGKISGSGGVNTYSGPYQAGPGSAFKAGPIAATEMASVGPRLNRAEAAYFTLLAQAKSYKVSAGRLTLYDGTGNESLIFGVASK